jgi:hypothetical protein
MKTVATVLGLVAIITLFGGYMFAVNYGEPGSGTSKTETRELDSFDRISLTEIGTINVSFGVTQMVTVTTDDNLVDLVETTVEDGELIIRPSMSINPKTDLVIDIMVPQLSGVELAGAASLNINGIDGESLDIELAGACGVDATGTVKNLTIEMAGACRARLKTLETENAEVDIAGTGSAVVFASESIDATASGFASITCHGNPKNVQKEANGISKVNIIGS